MSKADKKVEKISKELGVEMPEVKIPLPLLGDASVETKHVYFKSGFEVLDRKMNGGFIKGAAYLIAAVEKAGKSTLLRQMIFRMYSLGTKIAVIDIEQSPADALRGLATIANNKAPKFVTKADIEQVKGFLDKGLVYITRGNSKDLLVDENNDFIISKCIDALERAVDERGAEVCVFDNVTPFGAEGDTGSANKRMKLMGALVSLAVRKNVVVLVVGHVNEATRDSIADDSVRKAVESGHPEDIVKNTVTTVRRPLTKDIFGGSILTQFAGKLLLWRPYQGYDTSALQRYAWLLGVASRYCADFVVNMRFDVEKVRFSEADLVGIFEHKNVELPDVLPEDLLDD